MKPVGPEDPQVYWRRRALVGGIVLLVLVLLWLIFRPKGEPDPEPVAAPASPSVIASTPASPLASPSGSSSSSASPSGSCSDSDIDVTVTTSEPSYSGDTEPELTMAIANTGTEPCQRDVGSGANEIIISSGGVKVWSSDDCSDSSESDVVTLRPGEKASVTVSWPRVSSDAGCSGEGTPVEPGAYDAVGRNDKVESPETAFTLQ